jgi:hypothetical protein
MKLAWERTGIVRLTARIEELAALVAGGRLALAALDGQAGERGDVLARVLADFDRAARALRTQAWDSNPGDGIEEEGAEG